MNRSKFLLFLIIVLALGGCYECAKLYIGDGCKSGDINGRCTLGSECKTHAAFIQHRLLTKEQIKSCALGVYEEIICCPLDNEVNKKLLMESPTYYEDVLNTQQSGFGSGNVGSGSFRNTENGGSPVNINDQLALQNSGATADCAETTQRVGLNTGFGQDSSAFGNNNNNNQDFFDEPSAFSSPQQQQQHSNNNAGNTDQIFNGQSAFGESAFPKTPVDNAPKRKLCDPHHKDCIVYRDDEYIKFKVGDWCSFKSYVGTCAARSNCTTLKRLFDAHLVVNDDVSTCGFNAYEEIICCPSY